ncbi:MAG: hypothetical protein AB1646_15765 [Thermodesulfobacteriota bacterium]
MIEMLLSGEGPSDIGEKDPQNGTFNHGPIAVLTSRILAWNHKHDVTFHFRTRAELKSHVMTLKGKPKGQKGTAGKGHSLLAFKLAWVAKENNCDVAVLMRDADNRDFTEVYEEIRSGFVAARFDRGIPAVPVPKSEAWIICCVDPGESDRIERRSEDMKALLEQKLRLHQTPDNIESWRDIVSSCDLCAVRPPSFVRYKRDMEGAVRYLY